MLYPSSRITHPKFEEMVEIYIYIWKDSIMGKPPLSNHQEVQRIRRWMNSKGLCTLDSISHGINMIAHGKIGRHKTSFNILNINGTL